MIEMNQVQREMLKNAGLLYDVADDLVKRIEDRDYHAVSEEAALTGQMMYQLSRMAVAAYLKKEDR